MKKITLTVFLAFFSLSLFSATIVRDGNLGEATFLNIYCPLFTIPIKSTDFSFSGPREILIADLIDSSYSAGPQGGGTITCKYTVLRPDLLIDQYPWLTDTNNILSVTRNIPTNMTCIKTESGLFRCKNN